jgi:hypothetical protein
MGQPCQELQASLGREFVPMILKGGPSAPVSEQVEWGTTCVHGQYLASAFRRGSRVG